MLQISKNILYQQWTVFFVVAVLFFLHSTKQTYTYYIYKSFQAMDQINCSTIAKK